MRKSWLLCVLLGAVAWGQMAPATPATPPAAKAPAAPSDPAAAIPMDAPVITVEGVCPPRPKTAAAGAAKSATAAKTPSADCKTVITRAEFEKMAKALSPTQPLTAQQRKQLASNLARFIPLESAAKKKGLEKSEQYAETLKYAKMQILSGQMISNIQQEASNVPQEKVEQYYKEHPEAYEQFVVERLYVPRTKQVEPETKDADDKDKDKDKDAKPTEEQIKAKEAEQKAKTEAAEQAMTTLADSLHTRAVAGEDFAKLQKEAFEAAGMKIESPTVVLPKMRRTGLPPAQASVFDMKAGEVSAVISDGGGHYIFKVDSKDVMPLNQAQTEIHNRLQSDQTREAMDKITAPTKTVQNEAYFGAGGPMGSPMGGPRPGAMGGRMAMPQQASPQTPPAAQTPAQPAAAKPN